MLQSGGACLCQSESDNVADVRHQESTESINEKVRPHQQDISDPGKNQCSKDGFCQQSGSNWFGDPIEIENQAQKNQRFRKKSHVFITLDQESQVSQSSRQKQIEPNNVFISQWNNILCLGLNIIELSAKEGCSKGLVLI